MKLERFYYMENRESGKAMILCTEGDALIGCVYYVREPEENERMLNDIANGRSIAARVPGHSIFITPANTISGRRLPADEVFSILREMAVFFLIDRIKPKPGNFVQLRDSGEKWTREQAPIEVDRLIEKYNKTV